MAIWSTFTRTIGCVCLLATACWAADESQRLNVLLITSDDLGLQLGCYGDPEARTPNLDRFAADAVRFATAYVAQASCSPSRSAMFTGLYPHTNGQYALTNSGYSLHERFRDRTLPNLLKDAGYRTGLIGKLHVAPEESFEWDTRFKGDTRNGELVAAAASKVMTQSDKPFFLMVNYSDPHWVRKGGKGPWFFHESLHGQPEKVLTADDVEPFAFQGYSAPKHLARIAGYRNAVHRMDAEFGMLMDALEKSGQSDRTVILFLGDHGPPFARGKTTCYEAGLRVPYIVRWPGVSKPHTSRAMVSAVDLLPTILDAAGAEIPQPVHGRSLRDVLQGETDGWREYLAAEFHSHGLTPFYPRRAIRDGRYKLIHNMRPGTAITTGIDGDPGWREERDVAHMPPMFEKAYARWQNPPEYELFDLQADPWELTNLADEPSLAGELERLQGALMQWRQETQDPLMDPAFVEQLANNAAAGQGAGK